ncbi:MAG TPA: hypothetical protein VKZ18_11905 [Polyangia bacterium]|nr:hypothetical protein [Polyangia bacterium]
MKPRSAPAARLQDRLSILARLQRGLEALYRVETNLAIDAFMIDAAARAATPTTRAPREQLLVRQEDGELGLGLFLDADALANLERNDPSARLDERNFTDFCLAVEGVSHFVYVALHAAGDRAVSQLELELQAEVDKFACCVLVAGASSDLRRRLYGEVHFAADLDDDERARYQAANNEARRYAGALERRYVRAERTEGLLAELRRFYRMDLPDKLGHIARLD